MADGLQGRGWLILSRYVEQEIVIGTTVGEVMIKVIEIRDDKVRLAIDAPRCVPVDRSEVFKAKQRAIAKAQPNREAAKDSAIATEGVLS